METFEPDPNLLEALAELKPSSWSGRVWREAVGSGGHELAFVHAIRNETDVVLEGGDQSR